MTKRERRYIPVKELRVQQTDEGKVIAGYAVVYNSLSEDMGFREMVAPGTFTACLVSSPDVRCLFNHDDNLILGRTVAGTLTLADDSHGLSFRCLLPDTTVANDLAVSIERGDINQCSFGFMCDLDEWTSTPDYMLRTIKAATLLDVSPVAFPAYTATNVSMRSLFPDGAIEVPALEKRDGDTPVNPESDIPVGCGCDCPECVEDCCENCTAEPCKSEQCDCSDYRTNRLLASVIERRLR